VLPATILEGEIAVVVGEATCPAQRFVSERSGAIASPYGFCQPIRRGTRIAAARVLQRCARMPFPSLAGALAGALRAWCLRPVIRHTVPMSIFAPHAVLGSRKVCRRCGGSVDACAMTVWAMPDITVQKSTAGVRRTGDDGHEVEVTP
jgi:hypothetical protein